MNFNEILSQAIAYLQAEQRISCRALKRRLQVNDEYLADLKAEIIDAKHLAIEDSDGVLVWTGAEHLLRDPFVESAITEKSASERRQLTVMFCDIVDSTALAQRIDPEDLTELLHTYYNSCAAIVRRHAGFLAQYLGDGVLVYFGYPISRENDAQRAIRAGLEMITQTGLLNIPAGVPSGTRLRSRVGIHTGLVVVGNLSREGQQKLRTITGDTPNIAARLQQQAEPDTIVISEATRRLVEGFFVLEDLGARPLKGITNSVRVYQVIAQTSAESQFEVATQAGLLPLVGREQESEAILDLWEGAKAGHGKVLLLEGEPGIGKSRLVMDVKQRIEAEGAAIMELRCSPYNQSTAFYPLIRYLEVAFGLQKDDAVDTKMAKITRALAGFRFATDETPQLFGALLSLPGVGPVDPDPRTQKRWASRALLSWMVEQCERVPNCMIMEDLHWADASTIEYLGMLAAELPAAPLLTLMTFRPDFAPPSWAVHQDCVRLSLSRLGMSDIENIIQSVAGKKALPPEVTHVIARKADGIPLFAEELTKMVLESGLMAADERRYRLTGPLPVLAIPSTLQDSLMARLDRLGGAKEVAQLAAVLGREFSYDVLKAISDFDDENLYHALVQLIESGLVLQHENSADRRYLFKHALVRDAAYDSLLKSTRQKYHQRVADTLEKYFPETIEAQPEILARHLTEANQPARAIAHWLRGGERAARQSANLEAINHFTEGLALVNLLPQDLNRDRLEFELYLGYLPVLSVVQGWAAPQARAAYARAQELCETLGERLRMSGIYYGLSLFHIAGAQHRAAHDYARLVLDIARSGGQPESLLVGNWIVGCTLYFLGRPKESYELLVEALKYKDAWQEATLLYGQHPEIECMCFQAQCLWPLGYPDSALRKMEDTIRLAARSKVIFNFAYASVQMLRTMLARREYDAAIHNADRLIAFCSEHNFEYIHRVTDFMKGFALIFLGKANNVDDLRASLADLMGPGINSFMYRPFYQTSLAECYELLDRSETALALIEEALATIQQTGERSWEPEALRAKGNTLMSLARNQPFASSRSSLQSQAEQVFLLGIETAREQGAKSHELRATTSLSRLLASTGRRAAARRMLNEVYNWFSEGFGTQDLIEARELIAQL
jgi:predicted ATPase/class 3 adenylate cyclase